MDCEEDPIVDARWFCQESVGASLYYDRCTSCISEPLCCDYALARNSSHYIDAKRCVEGDASNLAAAGSLCEYPVPGSVPMGLPAACPLEQADNIDEEADPRWFCQEDTASHSYYDHCTNCASEPLCCDFGLARDSTHYTDAKRCVANDDSNVAGGTACEYPLPASCPNGH